QAEIAITMVEDQQQPRTAQPIGEYHPPPMHRVHRRALTGGNHQAIPLEPGIGPALAAKARLDTPANRQGQFALGLGEWQAAGRGCDAGDSFVEFLDQRRQLGPLTLTLADLLLL